jgi:hypothetical protein
MRWAWAAFGCYTKAHGTRGRVSVSTTNAVLAAEMGVPVETLHSVIRALPHVQVEEGKSVNGTIAVTWQNWTKYQEDSTVAQRQKASRAKRRGEERREDETRDPPLVLRTGSPPPIVWPESLREIREWLVGHDAPPSLHDPAYWRRIDDWLGAPDSGIGYLDELAKYLAWLGAQPRSRGHQDLKRGFRNGLAKSEYWSHHRAQTDAIRRGRR